MLNRQTTQDQIYLELRQLLANGTFKQGERIQEERLTRQFNVSRTPLREALSKLVQDGLLVSVPYKGAFVRTYSAGEVQQLFEIRALLEAFASRAASLRATEEEMDEIRRRLEDTERVIANHQSVNEIIQANTAFHMAIANAAHNTWLVETLESLHAHFGLLRSSNLTSAARRQQVVREHRELVTALLARDADEAERLARHHMADARDFAKSAQDGDAAAQEPDLLSEVLPRTES